MDLALLGKLLGGFQGKQGSMGGEDMKQILEGTVQENSAKEEVNPNIKIFDNPLEAIEKNEKLRNAVAAQGKKMGWDLLPRNSLLMGNRINTNPYLGHENRLPIGQ